VSNVRLVVGCIPCQRKGQHVPATLLAPALVGDNGDLFFVPICVAHIDGWYDQVPDWAHFPMVELPGA
jgi:hypothetical protein